MKPKYARMPPPPKTEKTVYALRILQLEAEVAYLKELRGSDFRTKPSNGNYPKVKNTLSVKNGFLVFAQLARSTFFAKLQIKPDRMSS